MIPTSPFALGRMRHLDLLALYYQAFPELRGGSSQLERAGRMSKEWLATQIIRARVPAPLTPVVGGVCYCLGGTGPHAYHGTPRT